MSYCDFNPRLFKPFTSMKTKIIPGMADDWEMVPATYRSNSGFSLKSKKLNQEVADIELYRFLKFSKEFELKIDSLKLEGNFIVGNDRSVYTEDMYNEWREKFEKRTETIIDKKDYKVGHHYKTPCGAEYVYLGFKYMSNIKNNCKGDYSLISKVTKKYLVIGVDDTKKKIKTLSSNTVSTLSQKFTKDFGEVITEDRAAEYLEFFLGTNPAITCFEDTKPKTEEYELQEMFMPRHALNYHNKALIVKRGGSLFASANGYGNVGISISYYGPEIGEPTAPKTNSWGSENYEYREQNEVYKKSQNQKEGGWFYSQYYTGAEFDTEKMYQKPNGWGRNAHEGEVKVDKMFRLGIKK